MNSISFRTTHTHEEKSAMGRAVIGICLILFVLILALALSGSFEAVPGEKPIAILLAVTVPVIMFCVSYMFIKAFRDWLLELDMRPIILLHSWRMIGLGFVFLYFHDQLPALFALPAGIGDAIAAIGALFIGIALFKQKSNVSRKWIYTWNTFGLLDFIIAISMGVATRTNEMFYSVDHIGSDIMGTFPLVMIPGFAVPFYIITHLIIFAQLKNIKQDR